MAKSTAPTPPSLARAYAWFSAMIAEDTALMEDLLLHGLDVDVPHPLRHTTALMEATRLGRTVLVSWLLSRGAAPAFLCGLPRGTPLHCALRRHHWPIAEQLIAACGSGSVVDAHGRTPLHILAMDLPEDEVRMTEALGIATLLIKKGCPLDALDDEGITALHHAVVNDYTLLANMLLANGANPNMRTPDRQVTPLMIAAIEKNITMIQMLLAYGADMHATTKDGSSPVTILPMLARLSGDAGDTVLKPKLARERQRRMVN